MSSVSSNDASSLRIGCPGGTITRPPGSRSNHPVSSTRRSGSENSVLGFQSFVSSSANTHRLDSRSRMYAVKPGWAILNGRTVFALDDTKDRSEEHTSELQSRVDLVCRLLLEKKNTKK